MVGQGPQTKLAAASAKDIKKALEIAGKSAGPGNGQAPGSSDALNGSAATFSIDHPKWWSKYDSAWGSKMA